MQWRQIPWMAKPLYSLSIVERRIAGKRFGHSCFYPCQRSARSGQVTIEYFILLAILAAVTMIALSQFDNNLKGAAEDVYRSAVSDMNPSVVPPT